MLPWPAANSLPPARTMRYATVNGTYYTVQQPALQDAPDRKSKKEKAKKKKKQKNRYLFCFYALRTKFG